MSLFWQCLPFSCFSSVGKTDRLIVEKCARDIFFEPRTWPYYLLLLRQAVQGWHNNHYLVSFLFFFEKSKDIQVPKLFLSLLLYRLSADSILKDPKFSLIYIPWVSPSWGFWEKKSLYSLERPAFYLLLMEAVFMNDCVDSSLPVSFVDLLKWLSSGYIQTSQMHLSIF